MRLYIRKVRVTLSGAGGNSIENLKIGFDIEASISGTPNVAQVDIWNLSESSRNKVGKEWDKIEVEAGYLGSATAGGGGNVGTIFKGFIRDVEHHREQVDIRTHVECGDGDRGYREGVISETVDEGTKLGDLVRKLLREMPEVDEGDLKGLDDAPPIKRPMVLYGSVASEMDKLSRSHEFYWSIQNGVLETIPKDGYLDEEVLISPRTGMIGTPTLTDTGIKVATLLNPHIRPHRVVRVESETLEMNTGSAVGRFRVDKATYRGDNGVGESPGTFAVYVEGTRI